MILPLISVFILSQVIGFPIPISMLRRRRRVNIVVRRPNAVAGLISWAWGKLCKQQVYSIVKTGQYARNNLLGRRLMLPVGGSFRTGS